MTLDDPSTWSAEMFNAYERWRIKVRIGGYWPISAFLLRSGAKLPPDVRDAFALTFALIRLTGEYS